VLRTWRTPQSKRLIINILAASVPAAVIGLPTNQWVEDNFSGPFTVALALLVGGVGHPGDRALLPQTDGGVGGRHPAEQGTVGGLLPGAGDAVAGDLALGGHHHGGLGIGLSRKAATEFSFFMAIPRCWAPP
jgi:undecaprenyl-diphosphatase